MFLDQNRTIFINSFLSTYKYEIHQSAIRTARGYLKINDTNYVFLKASKITSVKLYYQGNLIMRPSIFCIAQTIYIWPFVYLAYLSIERSSLDIVGPVLQHIRPCQPTEQTRVSKALCTIGQTTSNIKHQWLCSNNLLFKYFYIIGLKLINIYISSLSVMMEQP